MRTNSRPSFKGQSLTPRAGQPTQSTAAPIHEGNGAILANPRGQDTPAIIPGHNPRPYYEKFADYSPGGRAGFKGRNPSKCILYIQIRCLLVHSEGKKRTEYPRNLSLNID